MFFGRAMVVVSLLMLAGCVSATDLSTIPLRQMLHSPPEPRTLIVVEEAGVLPATSKAPLAGVQFTQVDLESRQNVMVGYNHAWLAGHVLREGDLKENENDFAAGAAPLPYEIFNAWGTDYALTSRHRTNNLRVEVVCYGSAALVYRLRSGAINFIPKELQAPLYKGVPPSEAAMAETTADVRRALERFPVGRDMELAVPDVVAVIGYEFANDSDCRTFDEFTIIAR